MAEETAARGKKAAGKKKAARSEVPADALLRLYEDIVRIRLVEERLAAELARGTLVGTLYPATGQEAVAAACLAHLGKDDWISPTPRELGAHLLRGVSVSDIVKRFSPLVTTAGSAPAHLGSMAAHTTPPLGPTADNVAVAGGIALTFKVRKQPHVALAFFGDGVMNTGTWHEAANFCAALHLPAVLVCNNNGWSGGTPSSESCRVTELGARAEAYGLPHESVDGTDAEAVYLAAGRAVARARSGGGTTVVECRTPRLGPHATSGDVTLTASTVDDVLTKLQKRLLDLDLWDGPVQAQLNARIGKELDEALRELS